MILLDLISQSYADFEIVIVLASKFLTLASTTRLGVDDDCSSKRIREQDGQHDHEYEVDEDGILSEQLCLTFSTRDCDTKVFCSTSPSPTPHRVFRHMLLGAGINCPPIRKIVRCREVVC